MKITEKYKDRHITNLPAWEIGNRLFKRYNITHHSNTPPAARDWEFVRTLTETASSRFPPDATESFLGYLIYHRGYDSNYYVISWWSTENMLRMFGYSSTRDEPGNFTPVEEGLNICVWDMLIHNFERNLFVEKILSRPEKPDVGTYLNLYYK